MYFLQDLKTRRKKTPRACKFEEQKNTQTNKQTKGKKTKQKWSSAEPYMPQETTTKKKRFENALKYRDYKQLKSSWLNSHSHFGLQSGRRSWSPLKVIPIPAPAAIEAIMMRKLRCIEEVQAHLKSKTNKQTDKKNKRAKHAGSLAQRLHDFKQQPRNQTSLPEPTSDLIN